MPDLQQVVQISQLPLTAILAIAVWLLYQDNKTDREKAAAERAEMLNRLQTLYIEVMKGRQ